MTTRFGFMPAASVLVAGEDEQNRIIGDYIVALEHAGGERWTKAQFGDRAPLFFLVATGGTERVVLDLHTIRQESAPDEPVLLIAHPGNNSLPAALEVLARMQQDGARGRIFYLSGPDDVEGLRRITQAASDLDVRRTLHGSRVGLIGDPSDWLVASMTAPEAVTAVWGPEIVFIPVEELKARIAATTEEDVAVAADGLARGATGIVEPTAKDLTDVARVHAALRDLVKEHELDALTVRCFDLVLDLSMTGCFGLAELTDNGVIAGCEGDLPSTIGLLWASLITGEVPWMANPAQLDESANTLWLAHCTVPRRMVESYRLRSHFESGLGVGIQGVLPKGPVTLLRLGGVTMERLWCAEGDLIESGDAENLCRTQAKIHLTDGSVGDLLHSPLGNHIVLVPGHHAARLRAWWETVIH